MISGIGDVSVATRIAELFSDLDVMRAQAQRGRHDFLSELCYSATLERLGGVFATLEDSRREMPPNWERAYELARSVPAHSEPVLAGGDTRSAVAAPIAGTAPGELEIVGNEFVQGRVALVRRRAA